MCDYDYDDYEGDDDYDYDEDYEDDEDCYDDGDIGYGDSESEDF